MHQRSHIHLHCLTLAAMGGALLVFCPTAVRAAALVSLTSFGGGDGWRSPDEILVGDAAGTETGGFYNYLQATNLERGMAYNPVTGNLILLSRSSAGNGVRILNGSTGVDQGSLNEGSGFVGGTIFTRNMIGVADDGAIYAGNLTVSGAGSSNFKIYRWTNEAATPTVAYSGDPLTGARIGDSLDVFGSGADTRIAAGYRKSPSVVGNNGFAIFDTVDGSTFTSTHVSIASTPPDPGDFGLGITFQDADTVIGRQPAGAGEIANPVARITDVSGSTGTLDANFVTEGAGLVPMDFAVVDGTPLLALVNVNNSRLFVYDLTEPFDQVNANSNIAASVALPVNNANGNATGQVKFGAITGNTAIIYAMNTNNGIQAFELTLDDALEGDHNGDGVVDAADYVAWRKTPTDFGGDPAGYDVWKEHFGESGAGSGGGPAAGQVPEPSGALLVMLVAIASMLPRRR